MKSLITASSVSKRMVFTALCSILILVLLAGCGKSATKESEASATPTATTASTTAPAADPTIDPKDDAKNQEFTLSVSSWTLNPEDPSGKDRFINYEKAVEAKFKEKYPKATIKWDFFPGDKYFDKIKAQLATSTAADVIFHQSTSQFALGGYLADLSDQSWVGNMLDSMKQAVTIQGKQYGAVLDVSASGVFYNKKLFTDKGWAVPQTWAEFIALCEQIKAAGIAPIEAGFKDAWSVGTEYSAILTNAFFAKNVNLEKDMYTGAAKFNGPELMDAINKWTQLSEKKFFNNNALSIGYDQAMQEFGDGKSAMFLTASWTPGYVIQKNKDFATGFFAMPDDSGQSIIPTAPNQTLSVNAKSAQLDRAKELLAVMVDKDILGPFSLAMDVLPGFKDQTLKYTTLGMDDLIQALQSNPTVLQAGTFIPQSAKDSVDKLITKITAGGKVDKELEDAQKNYDKDKSQISIE